MHLDDIHLTEAPLAEMLAACNGVLQEINRRDIYERHNTGNSKRADVTDFFEDLARLSLDDQQRCFNTIVEFLKERGKGVEHVVDRLLKGKRNYLSELILTCRHSRALFNLKGTRG